MVESGEVEEVFNEAITEHKGIRLRSLEERKIALVESRDYPKLFKIEFADLAVKVVVNHIGDVPGSIYYNCYIGGSVNWGKTVDKGAFLNLSEVIKTLYYEIESERVRPSKDFPIPKKMVTEEHILTVEREYFGVTNVGLYVQV